VRKDSDIVTVPMATDERVYDSPTRWVAKHISEYVGSNGSKGHRWNGVYTLLLTTRGRRSGKLRRTALIYERDGGSKRHPAWYVNLVANPEVHVQVGSETFNAIARTAAPEEKPRLWSKMTAIWPDYDSYQARCARAIPVVVLEPREPG
jgi:deazaflavin-dependent oxidoreductase (nitroreductase family)